MRRRRVFNQNEAELSADVKAIEKSINENENDLINSIGHSGNSDVDLKVDINVDTTSIGFAILCSLLATGQMNKEEFQVAVKKLEELTNRKSGNFLGRDDNSITNVRLFQPRK